MVFSSSYLGLGSLLTLLRLLLDLLGLVNGLLSGSNSLGWLLVTESLDLLQLDTSNGTLGLGRLSSTLLDGSDILTLLVETTENDGPVELGGAETLVEVRLALAVQETESLAISTDKGLAVTRVDFQTREVAKLSPVNW